MNTKIPILLTLAILSITLATGQLEFKTEEPIDFRNSLDLNQNTISNLSNPSDGQDAATKSWTGSTFLYRDNPQLGAGNFDLAGGNIRLSNGYISNDGDNEGIKVKDSGNVKISNGSLNLGGSKLVVSSGGHYISNATGDVIAIYDSFDNKVIEFDSGGNDIDLHGSGNIRLNGGTLRRTGTIKTNKGDFTINTRGFGGDTVSFYDSANSQYILKSKEGGNVEIPNGNLDLSGNNITGVDKLEFTSGLNINGSINTSGGNLNLETGNIGDVDSIDGGGDSVLFRDNIDLSGSLVLGNTDLTESDLDALDDGLIGDGELSNSITVGTGGEVQAEAIDGEGATSGQVLQWDGSNWVPATDKTGTDDQDIGDVLSQGGITSEKLDISGGKLVVPTGDVY